MPYSDEKILSFGDALIRRSDLALLEGPYWLSDCIIEFYFEYLNSELSAKDDRVLLIGPSAAFWLMHCQDEDSLRESTSPLNLEKRDLVLLPVNDSTSFEASESGTHWSLLVFSREDRAFYHLDSSQGMNSESASLSANALSRLLDVDFDVEEVTAVEQVNGYDCGMYVAAFADFLCDRWRNKYRKRDFMRKSIPKLERKVTPEFVSDMRGQMKELILSLAESSSDS